MFIILCFVVHYTPGLLKTLYGSVRGMDENIHFQFEVEASLFSEESTLECLPLS